MIRICILIGAISFAAVSQASVQVSGRHLIIFTAQPDQLFGSYLFGIDNSAKQPEKGSAKIMVPMETIDFRAVEGVEAEDLKLSEKGSLTLEREFRPGMTFVGIDFLVEAQFGRAELTFVPTYPLEELSLLVQQNSKLKIEGSQLSFAGAMNLQQGSFDRYTVTAVQPGSKIFLKVKGVPLGRSLYWWIGAGFGALLLLASVVFAKRTWPR